MTPRRRAMHRRDHHLAGEEHAGDVEVHLAPPVLLGEVRRAAHLRMADIVVEDVHGAELATVRATTSSISRRPVTSQASASARPPSPR